MKIRFTKMQGAGNDFVVLDATQEPLSLSPDQLRRLADRRFGVGADQILVVTNRPSTDVDFGYRIFNHSGEEVEQCGNGARCFVRYVRDKGLSEKSTLRVQTVNSLLELHLLPDGRVRVDMNAPVFDLPRVPFHAAGLRPHRVPVKGDADGKLFEMWPLNIKGHSVEVAVLSMGNPHAVQLVDDVDTAPVESLGPLIEHHTSFPRRVNAGFMQVVSRSHIRLRVFERGAGETLACGTGACAAVVAGIRLGLLDAVVDVDTRGGRLTIEWQGNASGWSSHVFMSGPAETVFEGEIDL
ncbi:MAG: diaminopimelate epimerase [Burkholderiales bacterium 28-67-8]|nr:MAG: diaminopimelate epimerase [Burkholderiales bacterium 28-67-8]